MLILITDQIGNTMPKYDLTTLKLLKQNDTYALYLVQMLNDKTAKGVRLNKKTNDQVEVKLQMKPDVRVIELAYSGQIVKIH